MPVRFLSPSPAGPCSGLPRAPRGSLPARPSVLLTQGGSIVGPLPLQHAHQVVSRPRLRRRLLGPPLQAPCVARLHGRRLRRRPGVRGVQLEPQAGVARPEAPGVSVPLGFLPTPSDRPGAAEGGRREGPGGWPAVFLGEGADLYPYGRLQKKTCESRLRPSEHK